jgi:phage RecT family recombinase
VGQVVPTQKKRSELASFLREQQEKVLQQMPDAEKSACRRLLMGAYQCIASDNRILEAAYSDLSRFRAAVYRGAQLGLSIGTDMSADSHLLAYGRQLTLVLNYHGLKKLAYQSGIVRDINAYDVCEGDEFSYNLGESKVTNHTKGSPRGEFTAVYVRIRLKDGGEILEVMTKEEIEKVRQNSSGGKSPAWNQWYSEQAKKTCLKRALKMAPRSERLSAALHLDDMAEAGKQDKVFAEADITVMPGEEGEFSCSAPSSSSSSPKPSSPGTSNSDEEKKP